MDNCPDVKTARENLAEKSGRAYWRSLDELSRTPEFEAKLQREFPREASVLNALGRREFLKLMGASLALAGLAGCGEGAVENIVPYVHQPELLGANQALHFSSAALFNGYALGAVITSQMGRPTKVEGNPSHPASMGAMDAFGQASVLSLYDPERTQSVLENGAISSWTRFTTTLEALLEKERPRNGAGIRILTETITSPTLSRLLDGFLKQFSGARLHQYQPINRDNERGGAIAAFGEDVETLYHFEQADVIVSLDFDFLSDTPGKLRYSRDFISRRRVSSGANTMNRLYVFDAAPTLAGSMADHRWPLKTSEIEAFARELLRQLGAQAPVPPTQAVTPHFSVPDEWMSALLKDLRAHRGTSLVLAGPFQPPSVHALAHALNQALGNVGKTLTYSASAEERSIDQTQSLRELVDDLNAGKVELLLALGGDPVYTAPADLKFEEAYKKARVRVHQGLYANATSQSATWHIPLAHELECWGDARAYDGTAAIIQPLILPLYNGHSMLELVARISGENSRQEYELLRETWRDEFAKSGDEERAWRTALSDGIVKGTARPEKTVTLRSAEIPTTNLAVANGLELNFRPSPSVWDGRHINNGWLQELPDPVTKLTWDNAVLLAPATAQKLGVASEDLVELRFDGRSIRGPVWVAPGHAEDSATVHLGYGQQHSGKVGQGTGFNAFALRTTQALFTASGVQLQKIGTTYPLASTQIHFNMEGRKLIQEGSLEEFQKDPEFLKRGEAETSQSLYPNHNYDGYAWGMVVDLSACTGCNACVAACQSENNIPIVGKDQVALGREMHWLRVDRYNSGDAANPQSSFQPVPCMQCENAPCELVCPVAATSHSAEGLNDMVYNRCIGTRYCSNNCPYKVRRFNFFQYNDLESPSARMRANPDVTVRERGVMEKCTYCVQRITHARIDSEKENRTIADGEVLPACAQTCPTQAIVFGNINDAGSNVAKLKREPLNYALLEELNTRPRTTYLARIRNPNPEIPG